MPAGWAAAAAAVGGALVSSDASRSASNKQATAAQNAAQTQTQQFNTINAQNAPFRSAGTAALSDILYGSGLGPSPTANGLPFSGAIPPGADQQKYQSDPAYRQAFDQFNHAHIKQYGVSVPGSADPGVVAQRVQAFGYDPNATPSNTVTASPDSTAGMQTGANDIGGLFTHQFNANDLNANMAPNYAFVLDQGQRAARNAGNLQTGLISGNTMKGLEDYTQGLAGNQYQQAYNNFTNNQSNIFNRLATIAGFGPGANQTTANAGTTLAGNTGSAQLAQGAAQAAGTVGSANALSGGINNAASWYTLGQIGNNGGTTTADPNFTNDAAASMAASG